MKRFQRFVISLAGLSIFGSGCIPKTGANEMNCWFNQSYDIKTNKCITPSNHEELYRTFSYNRIITDDQTALRKYQISFTRWLAPDELQTFLNSSDIKSTDEIVFFLPNTLHGTRAPQPITFPESSTSTVKTALRVTLNSLEGAFPDLKIPIEESALKSSSVKISIIRIFATPTHMAELWKQYPDTIRFAQTVKNDIDEAQMPFEPEQQVP